MATVLAVVVTVRLGSFQFQRYVGPLKTLPYYDDCYLGYY